MLFCVAFLENIHNFPFKLLATRTWWLEVIDVLYYDDSIEGLWKSKLSNTYIITMIYVFNLVLWLSCWCKPRKAREQPVNSFAHHLNIHLLLFSTSMTFLLLCHLPVYILLLRWSVGSLSLHQILNRYTYTSEESLVWLSLITICIALNLRIWMTDLGW